jgi:hypothetical protein
VADLPNRALSPPNRIYAWKKQVPGPGPAVRAYDAANGEASPAREVEKRLPHPALQSLTI